MRNRTRWSGLVLAVIMVLSIAACGPTRTLYTPSQSASATLRHIPNVRVWADDHEAILAELRTSTVFAKRKSLSVLALSGGGSEGAFGAGFLSGWSKTGKRPEFTIVTGTSVGALIAPFAFLGSSHDEGLESVFTKERTGQLVQLAGLGGLFGSSAFSEKPLQRLVEHYVDEKMLQEIAIEHHKGRLLLVLTTNIDTQRTAIWNMGAIAASQHPYKQKLFRQILIASASVPGILPPQLIEMQNGGQRFKEMHVDGGVSANVMLIPEAILASGKRLNINAKPSLYVLMNAKLEREFRLVKPSTIEILERSFGTAIKISTRNTLIASAKFARDNGWQIFVAALSADYPMPKQEGGLKQEVLQPLFQEGVSKGESKSNWAKLEF